MKKLAILLVILAVSMSPITALADGTVTSASRFRAAVAELEEYLASGIEDETKLNEFIDIFYRVGGKNGKLLGAYCDVLYYITQGMYELAVKCAETITENETFNEFLVSEIESNFIESGESLLIYAQARRAENALDDDEAFRLYESCFTFFDAQMRKDSLLTNMLDVKYRLGIDAINNGDYESACEYLLYASGYDYKDSANLLNLVERELNAAPPPCVHADTYFETVISPTCLSAGSQREICRACGEVLSTSELPRTGHVFGSWKTYSDEYDMRKCDTCSAYEERAISYGPWSEWTTYAITPTLGKRQVSTMFESETVYKYRKYHWYSETTRGWHNSPFDTSYLSTSIHGKWRYNETASPLEFVGEVETEYGVWRMYEGYWFAYTAQGTPAVTTTTTYYRYRDRIG